MPEPPEVAVLVPVKAFHEAKLRLAPALDGRARARLARAMAATVVGAAHDLPVWVVCDDDEVAAWAADVGAEVLWRPGHGLNAAVTDGVDSLARRGIGRVVVAHADLPHATDLRPLAAGGPDEVTLVPDRREDGTNVAVVPTACEFPFSYGPRSFHRHRATAERLGLRVRVVLDERLTWDVDLPADLEVPAWAGLPLGAPGGATP